MHGLAGKIGKCNASIIPVVSKNDATQNMWKAIDKYLSEVISILGLKARAEAMKKKVSEKKKAKTKATPKKKKSIGLPDNKFIYGIKDKLRTLYLEPWNISKLINKLKELFNKGGNPTPRKEGERIFTPTMTQVKELANDLDRLCVQVLDKNKNQLWVECPVLTKRRLMKEVITSECFNESALSKRQILESYKFWHKTLNWKRFGTLAKNGSVSKIAATPKDKDPVKKTRIISNQANSPWRTVLKRAARALNFLVLQATKRIRSFNLDKMSDLNNHLKKASAKFRNIARENPLLKDILTLKFDVKQMFTWLNKEQILEAVDWMFDLLKNHPTHRSRRCKTKNLVQVSKVKCALKDGRMRYHTSWHHSASRDEYTIFSFKDLKEIITMDLDHSHFIIGNKIFVQIQGCPIGGYLSAPLAVLKCIHDEVKFLASLRQPERLYGIRQVDDLLLLILHEKDNIGDEITHSLRRFRHLSEDNKGVNPVYTGGLQLEEEEVSGDTRFSDILFAGSDLKIGKETHLGMHAAPHFKNWEFIQKGRRQRFPRLPPNNSYMHGRTREVTIRGMLCLFKTQSSDNDALELAVHKLLEECKYPRRIFNKSLNILASRSPHTWKGIYKRFNNREVSRKILLKALGADDDNRQLATYKRRLW